MENVEIWVQENNFLEKVVKWSDKYQEYNNVGNFFVYYFSK